MGLASNEEIGRMVRIAQERFRCLEIQSAQHGHSGAPDQVKAIIRQGQNGNVQTGHGGRYPHLAYALKQALIEVKNTSRWDGFSGKHCRAFSVFEPLSRA
ncbi:hypothetical protein CC2G_008526 [Coprinopsis cinerea AmutBmut pab1-1]|nr:hypothetical protein CC2G_008526 [Coprinopsis cinerea AmutBmut pab1-1]